MQCFMGFDNYSTRILGQGDGKAKQEAKNEAAGDLENNLRTHVGDINIDIYDSFQVGRFIQRNYSSEAKKGDFIFSSHRRSSA